MVDQVQDGTGTLLPRKDPFSGDKREDGLHGLTAMLRLTRVRHGVHEGEEPSSPDLPQATAALRATLMAAAIEAVDSLGLSHDKAAERIGTTPETLRQLLLGQLDRFDMDTLVEILAHLGHRVDLMVVRRSGANA